MEEVTDTKTHEYATELIVEVMGVDSHGDFDIVSYEFTFDDDRRGVRPRGEIDPQHQSHVVLALESAGYTLKGHE